MSKKLEILKQSLAKKEQQLNAKFDQLKALYCANSSKTQHGLNSLLVESLLMIISLGRTSTNCTTS